MEKNAEKIRVSWGEVKKEARMIANTAVKALFKEHRPLVSLFLFLAMPYLLYIRELQRREVLKAPKHSPFVYTMQ